MKKTKDFDILVIGGGHAGLEACSIAGEFSLKTALITLPSVPIASAPCNPCIGGVGKGQVVRELDALGGVIGKLADLSGIQYRTLNESKGYAVHSTRVQIDKKLYPEEAEKHLSHYPNIDVIREKVISIERDESFFIIKSENQNWFYRTKKLILTVGTFLRGKIHRGSEQKEGGRIDTEASLSILELFKGIKVLNHRFKTGTPARIYRKSVDFSQTKEQKSDPGVLNFHWEFMEKPRAIEQVSCYITETNSETIEIIYANRDKSPMYNGQINAVGARYCPSIEDKVFRYPEKKTHHIFLEPEGLDSDTIYPSGISSSLPREIQENFLKTIKGLEKAEVESYGYAVEYDVIDTTSLSYTLEHKEIPGLYFAGQVNGTSGYEEAAGQGFIAGANAALSLLNKSPLILSRDDSYIGVMIEDLVTTERDEPYRLFTARSENRLYIREDNAYERMFPYRKILGLNKEIDMFHMEHWKKRRLLMNFCSEMRLARDHSVFKSKIFQNYPKFDNKISIKELIKWVKVDMEFALKTVLDVFDLSVDWYTLKSVAISIKYEGYIKRAELERSKVKNLDKMLVDWKRLCSSENISFECKQRIRKIKPETFGQLKRIKGIRPATLAIASSI